MAVLLYQVLRWARAVSEQDLGSGEDPGEGL
jgi:hypothetical protein